MDSSPCPASPSCRMVLGRTYTRLIFWPNSMMCATIRLRSRRVYPIWHIVPQFLREGAVTTMI
jgi:hypothetical protein